MSRKNGGVDSSGGGIVAFGNGVHRPAEDPAKKRKAVGEHHDGSFGVYMSHKIQKLRGQNSSFCASTTAADADADETARARRLKLQQSDKADEEENNEAAGDVPSASLPSNQLAGSSSETARLFDGVHVFVDGYTVPRKEELRSLVLQHGGGFEHYETAQVTHIIATHLATSKLLQYKRRRRPLPVVSPEWIVKSIEAKALLSVQPFLYRALSDPTQASVLSSLSLSASTAKSPAPASTDHAHSHVSSLLRAGGVSVIDEEEPLDENSFSESEGGSDEEDHEALASQYAAQRALAQRRDEILANGSKPSDPSRGQHQASNGEQHTNSTRDGPSFVRHFFAKSRLHHIGSWRTTFQLRAPELLSKYTGKRFRQEPATSSDRVILHVDMDCFFVSVAVRDKPQYDNQPVAIAHSSNAGSSEISSCNYLAREKGLRAGMFMQSAKQLCPELVVLPYQFEEIEACSFQIYDIFFSRTPYVQAMSCDEAYLEFGKGTDGVTMAKEIRKAIFDATRCTASVGVSYNILLAKLATREAKPDGLFAISTPEQAEPFVHSLKISDLPGVGHRMSAKMDELGLESMDQLRSLTKSEMQQHFGKTTSEMLFNYARGLDHRPLSVESNMMRKSVSAVVNFGIRFQAWKDATEFMMALAEELSSRLTSLKLRTKCLTLLIKKRREGAPVEPSKFMGHGVCDGFSRSQLLAEATDSDLIIGRAGVELLRQLHFPVEDLRGVGIQATKLVSLLKPVDTRAGERFRAWLAPDAEPSGSHVDRVEPPPTATVSRQRGGPYTESLSQINMAVLNELPEEIRHEVLASYRHQSLPPAARRTLVLQPPRTKGKQTLVVSRPTNPRSRQDNQGESVSSNVLNDIRLSQVDDDVYQALPMAIRREIDAHTKRPKGSAKVPTSTRHGGPDKDAQPRFEQRVSELQPIDQLFQELTVAAASVEDGSALNQSGVLAAFDAIFSRILVEIERSALDQALRMLRFVRRKCLELTRSTEQLSLLELVNSGFNLVLQQVNRELQEYYQGGSFSTRLVAPLL